MINEETKAAENQRDLELIEKIRNGNALAFSQLFNFHFSKLCTYNFSLNNNRQDAEDIAQEVFVVFNNSLKLGKYHCKNFGGWLRRTASFKVIDRIRNEKYAVVHLEVLPDGIEEEVEETFVTDENIAKVMAEINLLPERDSKIVMMRLWEQKSWKEIAAVFDIDVDSASGAYYKIIIKLKKRLGIR